MKLQHMLVGGAALAVASLLVLLGSTDTVRAGTFNPTITACLDDATTVDLDIATPGDPAECDGDNSAGASSDFTGGFNLPIGDVNFAAAVFFIPNDWGITPGEDIPIGAIVGRLTATATLGLLNNPCQSTLPVIFNMMNASIDPSDTVLYLDSEDDPDDVKPSGQEDLDPEYFEDVDKSGLQDGIEKYPDFITRVLDDKPGDEVGNPLQPIRRSAGITIVAGAKVLLQFLIFEPGTFINEHVPDDPELGYPSVTLLQNIGDPAADPIPGPITDFCTPLITSNTGFGVSRDNACTDAAGAELDPICSVSSSPFEPGVEATTDPDESGVPLLTNPDEPGTYTFTVIAAGQRDADGDGTENSMDTCPFVANEGDPRIKGDGDVDEDGLDAACDPNDDPLADGTNSDQDLDGYTNRQDNCPIEPNGEEGSNQRDTDDDTIGDSCDPDPDDDDAQGELTIVEVSQDIPIGEGGPADQETPPADETPTDGSDDDGGGGGTIIIIIVAVIAGVVVLGGGGYYFIRRRGA